MKEFHRVTEKYYHVEYYSGDFDCNTLAEAIRKVLHFREKPHWAFGDGSAKIYVREKEVIFRGGKCVKFIKPKKKKCVSHALNDGEKHDE